MTEPTHRRIGEQVNNEIESLILQEGDPDKRLRLLVLQNINGVVTNVADKLEQLDEKLSKHMKDETNELANEIARVMIKAFPRGDPDAHRLHHELAIRKAEASVSFWQTLSTELAKYGLIGFIGWAGYALWKAFLAGPR